MYLQVTTLKVHRQKATERVKGDRVGAFMNALVEFDTPKTPLYLNSNSNQVIGHLAAGISHEVNNPLSCIYSNLDLLTQLMGTVICNLKQTRPNSYEKRDALPNAELLLEVLEESKESCSRIASVVSDLQPYTGLIADQPCLTDLNRLLELAQQLDTQLYAGVELNFQQSPPQSHLVISAAVRVVNTLMHFCKNLPAPRDNNRLSVTTYSTPTHAYLEIYNSNACFTALQSGVEETQLNLKLAKFIIENFGGRLQTAAAEQSGFKFIISLPTAGEAA